MRGLSTLEYDLKVLKGKVWGIEKKFERLDKLDFNRLHEAPFYIFKMWKIELNFDLQELEKKLIKLIKELSERKKLIEKAY